MWEAGKHALSALIVLSISGSMGGMSVNNLLHFQNK